MVVKLNRFVKYFYTWPSINVEYLAFGSVIKVFLIQYKRYKGIFDTVQCIKLLIQYSV